jgi:formylglycine-generating enzyme required for sulfatase activity
MPLADTPVAAVEFKAGAVFVSLKTGWNLFTFPSGIGSRKFAQLTVTKGNQIKLLNEAASLPFNWIHGQVRVLRGRAILLVESSNGQYGLQAGGKYYVYSRSNGPKLHFNKPHVTGISPGQGRTGDTVTLSGVNFGASQGGSMVAFNGTGAGTASSWNDTRIVCAVPAGAATGPVVVTVGSLASNDDKIFCVGPTISGISPSSGPIATLVTISGTNFGASQGGSTMAFGGTSAGTASSWSDTLIVCAVPADAVTGPVLVTVGSLASNDDIIFSIPPSITGIAPASGPLGTFVTITGTHFGAAQGGSSVTFNGTGAGTAVSWSDTKIVCAAPAYGAVAVTVGALTSNLDYLYEFMAFVHVPAGYFTMGSLDTEGAANERPQHTVYLDAYEIGKYEVTNAQFKAFYDTTSLAPDAWGSWQTLGGGHPGYATDHPDCPVCRVGYVGWGDVQAFCTYYGYRLPTEAEWEKAARGTDARIYPWENSMLEGVCNNYDHISLSLLQALGMVPSEAGGQHGPVPVGSFDGTHPGAGNGASPYGCMDMAGNVWEWCSDFYDANYYAGSPSSNPQGPASGTDAVYRGSDGYRLGGSSRVAERAHGNGRDTAVGFRVVRLGPPVITGVSPSTWTNSTTVTLTGKDFGMIRGGTYSPASTVTFGGTSVTPTSWSNTMIVCKAPASGSVTPVIVTVKDHVNSRPSNAVPPN